MRLIIYMFISETLIEHIAHCEEYVMLLSVIPLVTISALLLYYYCQSSHPPANKPSGQHHKHPLIKIARCIRHMDLLDQSCLVHQQTHKSQSLSQPSGDLKQEPSIKNYGHVARRRSSIPPSKRCGGRQGSTSKRYWRWREEGCGLLHNALPVIEEEPEY